MWCIHAWYLAFPAPLTRRVTKVATRLAACTRVAAFLTADRWVSKCTCFAYLVATKKILCALLKCLMSNAEYAPRAKLLWHLSHLNTRLEPSSMLSLWFEETRCWLPSLDEAGDGGRQLIVGLSNVFPIVLPGSPEIRWLRGSEAFGCRRNSKASSAELHLNCMVGAHSTCGVRCQDSVMLPKREWVTLLSEVCGVWNVNSMLTHRMGIASLLTASGRCSAARCV